MNSRWVVVLMVMMVALIPVVSAEDEKELDPLNPFDPANYLPEPEAEVAPVTLAVEYQPVVIPADLIKMVTDFLGLTEETKEEAPQVAVVAGGDVLAVLPTDSKFVDVEVHTICLRFGYGTDRWFMCEQEQV